MILPPITLYFVQKQTRQKVITRQNEAGQKHTSNFTGFESFSLVEITLLVTLCTEMTDLLNLWLSTILQSHQAECRLLRMTAAVRHYHPQPSYSVIASMTSFCLDPQRKKNSCNSFSQDKMQSTATTFKTDTPGFFLFVCLFWTFYLFSFFC